MIFKTDELAPICCIALYDLS